MQLSKRAKAPGVSTAAAQSQPSMAVKELRLMNTQVKSRGFIKTGVEIVKRETALGLYKGLGAVVTGIVPKMAIRFTSFEWYKQILADKDGVVSSRATFVGMPKSLRLKA